MKLDDVLSQDNVFARAMIPDKRTLIRTAAERAAACLDIPPEGILAALERREDLGSTGLGDGVAIPHARLKEIARPVGFLWTLRSRIAFESVDGRPIDLAFALLLPATFHAEHLNLLALVARRFRDAPLVAAMRMAPDARILFRTFVRETPGRTG